MRKKKNTVYTFNTKWHRIHITIPKERDEGSHSVEILAPNKMKLSRDNTNAECPVSKILDSWISPLHLYCPLLLEISLSPSSSLPPPLSLSLHQSWYKIFHVRCCIALALRINQGLYCNPRFCNNENHPSGLSHRKPSCPTLDGFCCCLNHQRKNPETSFLLHLPCI